MDVFTFKFGLMSLIILFLFSFQGTKQTERFTSLKTEPNNRVCFRYNHYKGGDPAAPSDAATLIRLHPNHWPHLRRLAPKKVTSPTSGVANSRGVTGGVYKTRERIHRGMLIRDY